jgi:hypothetical protein
MRFIFGMIVLIASAQCATLVGVGLTEIGFSDSIALWFSALLWIGLAVVGVRATQPG